jgi:dUTP pyrophosphatase
MSFFVIIENPADAAENDRIKAFLQERNIAFNTVTARSEKNIELIERKYTKLPQVFWPDGTTEDVDTTIRRFTSDDKWVQEMILTAQTPPLRFRKLTERAQTPKRGTTGAAGYDLAYAGEKEILLLPNTPVKVSTGLAFEVPHGTYLRVAPRSGLGVKGIHVLAGVVDEDYRGEVHVILVNLGSTPTVLQPGDRIAQAIFEKITYPQLIEVEALSDTTRGAGGYGSTGR